MHIHAKYYSQHLRILPALSGLIGKSHTDGSQRCIKLLPQKAIVFNSLAINNSNNNVLFLWFLLFVLGTKCLGPVTTGFGSPQPTYHYLSLHITKHCLIQLLSVMKFTTVTQLSTSALSAIFPLASLFM